MLHIKFWASFVSTWPDRRPRAGNPVRNNILFPASRKWPQLQKGQIKRPHQKQKQQAGRNELSTRLQCVLRETRWCDTHMTLIRGPSEEHRGEWGGWKAGPWRANADVSCMMQLGVVFNDLRQAPGTLMSGPLPFVYSMGGSARVLFFL